MGKLKYLSYFSSTVLLVLLVAFNGKSATTKSESLTWQGQLSVLTNEGKDVKRLYFLGATYSDESFYNPSKSFFVENLNPSSFKISDEVYQPLTASEFNLVNESAVSSKLDIRFFESFQNGNSYFKVDFVPLRKNPSSGLVEKLVSFTYSFDQNSQNGRLSTGSARTSGYGASNSVLSSGKWYKISLNKDGIYKMDYAFLQSLGIDPKTINPKNIQVYGNGCKMLPQPNASSRYDDLVENAIKVVGEGDNSFDANDYVLFFGQSPDSWRYDSINQVFNHSKNIYTENSYYFITVGDSPGKRVADLPSISGSSNSISIFNERQFHETDSYNLLHSGREWYGEIFDYQNSQSFDFPINTYDPNGTLILSASFMCKSSTQLYNTNSFSISANGVTLGSVSPIGNVGVLLSAIGIQRNGTFSKPLSQIPTRNLTVNITYNNTNSPLVSGYLNWIEINMTRPLAFNSSQIGFRSTASTAFSNVLYSITNSANDLTIWDVTDPLNPSNQTYDSFSGGNSFGVNNNKQLREYWMFNGSDYYAPTFVKVVPNQNLHAITAPNIPDLVILTDASTLDAANRLASFRETFDGLTVEVVTTEQVYNEFSSGAQDISAPRDFMRMLYKRKTNQDSLRYLCLFGSCSYDYKDRTQDNTNLVPVYETYNSLDMISSFSSDDYFGLLDDNEGEWAERSTVNDASDIGIGRLPLRNSNDADVIVDKIIHYHSDKATLGNWRNKVSFLADAGDGNLHQDQANSLADLINSYNPSLNVNKFYVDFYQWQTFPDGVKAPSCNDAIAQAMQQGTFLFNYTGHGNEIQLSGQNIFNKSMINTFTNIDKLTFGIFATCEFGRYDDPSVYSGSETFVMSPTGGAIGTFNSSRAVYSNTNYQINDAFYKIVFKKTNGVYPRLGDIYKYTKNYSLSGINNRNYALLGDPSMRLEYPEQNVVITQFNDTVLTNNTSDTLRALSKVSFSGEIRDISGIKNTNFNGQVYFTIYDKENIIYTLGQKGGNNAAVPYKIRNNVIYNGLATVSSGGFNISMVIPKDIAYNYGIGKISIYAENEGNILDAAGNDLRFVVGGSNPNAAVDNTPPKIQLFMNDESFVFGGFTSANSLFIAKIFDESGINVSRSSVGHEITSVVSSNKSNVVIMNDYYNTDLNTYKSGRVQYPYKDLPQGQNSVTFKAWDTYNNSSEAYLEFVVANNQEVAIKNLLNYPNPFTTHTTFHFDHNKPGDDLEITVQIFTISGKLVKTLTGLSVSSSAHISNISWNGHDDFESEIGKGVYVYKLSVRSTHDGSEAHQYEKLVILN